MARTRRCLTVAVATALLATFICSAAESGDAVPTSLTMYNSSGQEFDGIPTTDQESLRSLDVDETISSVSPLSQSYTESLNDSVDDIGGRFNKIRQRAMDYPSFRRRTVQYPKCCISETGGMCGGQECVVYFITSVESDNITIESNPMKVCEILYDLLTCDDDESDECTKYCYCIRTEPVVTIVKDVATALYFGCVLLTLCVYASVPRLRNLYGKCLMSYLVALLLAESFATVKSKNVCSDTSVVVEYLLSFFSLARYGWVNMLCVEVCCVCRSFYSVRQPSHKLRPQGRRKFFYYSLAVWGGAAALFAVIHVIPGFASTVVNLVVIFLLLFSSCIPLVVTLKRLWGTSDYFDRTLAGVTRRKLCWFYMTSKLLCLSGIGKICSVIIYVTVRGTPYYEWMLILLKIEGPLLFLLFVCNYRVRGRVRERLSQLEWIRKE